MKITNRKNLPAALVRACENDPYDPGTADISITRLVAPPRQVALIKQHTDEITNDVADRIWALRSQGIHCVLERAVDTNPKRAAVVNAYKAIQETISLLIDDPSVAHQPAATAAAKVLMPALVGLESLVRSIPPSPDAPNEIAEVRWEREALGWRVSGKLDLVTVAQGKLTDWKDTSVWSIKDALDARTAGSGKKEWTAQVNLLGLFGRGYGYRIRQVEVGAFGRDWRRNEKLRYDDYPDDEVTVVPQPLWSEAEAIRYLEERVALHQPAQAGKLPDCTPEERWEKPTQYAVTKKGRKTAVRLYENRTLADQHAASQPDLTVVVRPGESTRCAQYCDALPFCDQGQKILAALAASTPKE